MWGSGAMQVYATVRTLKTGIPVEEADSILKLLGRVSCPEIQLGVVFYSELDFIFNFHYQL